jgi:hypothetical protein
MKPKLTKLPLFLLKITAYCVNNSHPNETNWITKDQGTKIISSMDDDHIKAALSIELSRFRKLAALLKEAIKRKII